jgi:Ca2+-binding RTX toxin-like protein
MLELLLPLFVGLTAMSLIGLDHEPEEGEEDHQDNEEIPPENGDDEPNEDLLHMYSEDRGIITAGPGADTIFVNANTGSSMFSIWDTSSDETDPPLEVNGSQGDDDFHLSGSGYVVRGDEGSDTIDLGDVSDAAVFGGMDDTITGGMGSDVYVHLDDNAVFQGGSGDDYVHSKSSSPVSLAGGDDVFVGVHEGKDLTSQGTDDLVYGGSGNDYLIGDLREFHLTWSHANDQGLVSSDHDTLYGDGGDDTINGSHGDLMYGGSGVDHFEVVLNHDLGGPPTTIADFDPDKETVEVRFGSGDGIEGSPEFFQGVSHDNFDQIVTDSGDSLLVDRSGQTLIKFLGTGPLIVGFEGCGVSPSAKLLVDLDGNSVSRSACDVVIRGQFI